MQLTSVLAAAAGFATLAVATPAGRRAEYPQFIPVSPDDVSSHSSPQFAVAENIQTVGVYVCTDANGQGDCAYVLDIPGSCTSLTGTGFNDQISFVDPTGNDSTPNASCTVYIDENCQGDSVVIDSPCGNLQTCTDADFVVNDRISSFRCVAA